MRLPDTHNLGWAHAHPRPSVALDTGIRWAPR
jgi:hypothetical protein